MTLKEQLQQDTKEAMRAGDTQAVGVLRMLNAAIANWEIEQRGKEASEPTESDIVAVLRKEAKKRRDSAVAFRAGNREDLATKEEQELEIIGKYLPAQITEDQIRVHVQKLIDGGIADLGALMKAAMNDLRDTADAGMVSKIAKELLPRRQAGLS